MKTVICILFIILLSSPLSSCKKPLAVSHLSAEHAAIIRRRDAPNHYFLSRLVCFDKHCRGTVGFNNKRKNRKFKRFKNRSIPPRRIPVEEQIKDSVIVAHHSKPQNVYQGVEVGIPIKFINANFEVNSVEMPPLFLEELSQFSTFLKEHPELEVRIIGHTDDVGTKEANQKLSQARAQSVVDYLIEEGINPQRLTAIGKGNAVPLRSGQTAVDRAVNRRVEFEIIEE